MAVKFFIRVRTIDGVPTIVERGMTDEGGFAAMQAQSAEYIEVSQVVVLDQSNTPPPAPEE